MLIGPSSAFCRAGDEDMPDAAYVTPIPGASYTKFVVTPIIDVSITCYLVVGDGEVGNITVQARRMLAAVEQRWRLDQLRVVPARPAVETGDGV